ncbi:MAG TPA: ATP-dependent helicase, partial [Mycobacteriales bacterium]|nr:ATP-dependent helicase [Mycobacteriales bacterium]
KVYLHRIGRTGRAGASGVAVTFVDWDELARWKMICDALSLPLHEPPETYSTSEHLFVDLDIPAGATGRLPRAQRTRAGLEAEEVEDLGETGAHAGSRRRSRPGSRPASGSASGPVEDAPPESRPRRSRARRRTRGGQPVDGSAVEVVSGETGEAATAAELAGAVATVEADLVGSDSGPGPGAGSGESPRRRRRRRPGRGRGTKPETSDDSVAESA